MIKSSKNIIKILFLILLCVSNTLQGYLIGESSAKGIVNIRKEGNNKGWGGGRKENNKGSTNNSELTNEDKEKIQIKIEELKAELVSSTKRNLEVIEREIRALEIILELANVANILLINNGRQNELEEIFLEGINDDLREMVNTFFHRMFGINIGENPQISDNSAKNTNNIDYDDDYRVETTLVDVNEYSENEFLPDEETNNVSVVSNHEEPINVDGGSTWSLWGIASSFGNLVSGAYSFIPRIWGGDRTNIVENAGTANRATE